MAPPSRYLARYSARSLVPFGFLLCVASAPAAAPATPSVVINKESVKQEFIAACRGAFEQSSKDAANVVEAGRSLCECAAQESKLQGVTTASLKHEAERIGKDPKYQIKDQHLLDAMRICFIDAYRD